MVKTKRQPVVNGQSDTPVALVPPLLKLDLGAGMNKREGFASVDVLDFPGIDYRVNLTQPWPWRNESVEEAHSSHFVEHLEAWERVFFFNELYRVLIPGGKCTLIVPHWASCRAYGDPTHKWPPVSEFAMYYLSREWRLGNKDKGLPPNAPHTDASFREGGFDCDFDATWAYGVHPAWQTRSQEAQGFAFQWYKEAILDIHATLVKK